MAASLLLVLGLGAGVPVGLLARRALAAVPSDLRTLHVKSSPAGAVVTLDGERVGTTPLVLTRRVAEGAHTIKLAVPDGKSVSRKVTVRATDRTVMVSEGLLDAGKVTIETRPAGARILIDGAEVGTSPLVLERVSTDRPHTVEARLAGFVNQPGTIPMDRPESWTLALPLTSTQGEGSVVIVSSPPAEILMDGAPWGETGPTARPCTPGAREIRLRAPGLPISTSYTINVPPSGTARYFFDLGARESGTTP